MCCLFACLIVSNVLASHCSPAMCLSIRTCFSILYVTSIPVRAGSLYLVQALRRLARAASARLEPIRQGQVSQLSKYSEECVHLLQIHVAATVRHAVYRNDWWRSILHPHPWVSAGALLCTLCTAGTYSTGTGGWVSIID